MNILSSIQNVAIYCRLSEADEKYGEVVDASSSIQSQKEILTEYVNSFGWNIYDYYIDDGYSGTNFDRPAFQRLINDIENKKINIVITKDLSRLGRNYIQTGYYTEEYFPLNNVRYIAINDSFDTSKDDNEFAPFKNIINEWYAKDISKKVRFSMESKARRGEYMKTSRPLYGYMKGETIERVPDPETAPIVKMIFEEYIRLRKPIEVAKILKDKKIVTPMYRSYLLTGYYKDKYEHCSEDFKISWRSDTITDILKKKDYLGIYITNKKNKISFKNKKVRKNKNPFIFENRFEPLISKELFDKANIILSFNSEMHIPKKENIFKGVCLCDNCLYHLTLQHRPDRSDIDRLVCYKKSCHSHGNVALEEVEEIVKSELKEMKNLILTKEEALKEYVLTYTKKITEEKEPSSDNLKYKYQERVKQLTIFIKKAFEAKAKGEIPVDIYTSMVKQYSNELETINDQLSKIETPIIETHNYLEDATTFINLIKSYNEETPLTYDLIHAIFKQIRIKVVKDNPRRRKTRKIFYITYNYIDDIIKEFISDGK